VKRFYRAATIAPAEAGGFAIHLDGKPLVTPGRTPLILPTRGLALAAAQEWNDQGDTIDPRSMPLTGMANAAIDRVAPERTRFIDGLVLFGESDLLCYRAETPDALAAEQAALWNPILDWSERTHGHSFEITRGIRHVAQPAATLAGLRDALAALDDHRLAALHPLVTIGGSLVTALALAAGAIDGDSGWTAVTIDEAWQERHWGSDDEANAALALKRAEWDSALSFLALLE
jgi:chaperone required for assembly of F1-ATPase